MSEVRTPLKQLINDDFESPLPSASAKTWAEVERVEPELASLNASFSRNRTLSSPGRMLSSSNVALKTSRQTWLNLKTNQGSDDKQNMLEDPVTLGLVDLNTGKLVQTTREKEKETTRIFHAEESLSSGGISNPELDPRSCKFSPLKYLRVLHKETSLDALILGLENIDETLKSNMQNTSESLKQNLDRIFIWKDTIVERYRRLEDLDPAYSVRLETLSQKARELVNYVYGESFVANAAYERRKHAIDLIMQHRNFFQLPSRLKQALLSGSRSHIMTEYHNINAMLQAQTPNAVVDKIKFTVEALMNEYLEGVYRQITDTGTSKEIVEILINFLLQVQPSKNHLERILELRVESSIDRMQKLYNDLVQVNNEQKELEKKSLNEPPRYQANSSFAANEVTSHSFALYVKERTKIVQNLCITYVDCLSELERFTLRLVTSKHPVNKLAALGTGKSISTSKSGNNNIDSVPKYILDITLSISKRVSDIFTSCLSFLLNFCSDNRFQLSLEEIIELRSCQKNISELRETFFDMSSASLYMDKLVTQYFDDVLRQVCAALKVIENIVDENFIHFFIQISTEDSPFSICLKDTISTFVKMFDTGLDPPPSVFSQLSTHFGQFFKNLSRKILERERNIVETAKVSESVLCYWNHTLLLSLAEERAQSKTSSKSEVLFEQDIVGFLMDNSKVLLDSCALKISSVIRNALVSLGDKWRESNLEDFDTCDLERDVFNSWLHLRKNVTCLHVIPSSARMVVLDKVLEYLREPLTEIQVFSDTLQRVDRKHLEIFEILLNSVSIADVLASSLHCSCLDEIHSKKEEICRISREQNVAVIMEEKKMWLYLEELLSFPMLLTND